MTRAAAGAVGCLASGPYMAQDGPADAQCSVRRSSAGPLSPRVSGLLAGNSSRGTPSTSMMHDARRSLPPAVPAPGPCVPLRGSHKVSVCTRDRRSAYAGGTPTVSATNGHASCSMGICDRHKEVSAPRLFTSTSRQVSEVATTRRTPDACRQTSQFPHSVFQWMGAQRSAKHARGLALAYARGRHDACV